MRIVIAASFLWLFTVTAAMAQGFQPPFDLQDAQAVAAGKSLFNRRCAGKCHGKDGSEGEQVPDLRDRPHLRAAYVYATLIGGRPGTAMPSWAGRLEETELWQVVAYVVSLHPERK